MKLFEIDFTDKREKIEIFSMIDYNLEEDNVTYYIKVSENIYTITSLNELFSHIPGKDLFKHIIVYNETLSSKEFLARLEDLFGGICIYKKVSYKKG